MERQFQSLNVVSTCVCGGSSQVKTGEVKRVHDIGIPQNNEYRITVRYIPGGKVTTYIHEKLAVGDIVQVSPPCGDCYYRSSKRNMVMLAGGNGVVALAPMIEKGLAEGRKVKFLYSNRSTETRSFGQF